VSRYLKEHIAVVVEADDGDDDGMDWPTLRRGILQALEGAYGREPTLVDLERLGPEGVRALAESVVAQDRKRRQLRREKRNGRQSERPSSIKVRFVVPHHGTEFELDWRYGDSLLDLAHDGEVGQELLGEYMEGTCGQQMSCCTCHVYLDDTTFQLLLPEVTAEGGERDKKGKLPEAERDMLDLAYEPKRTSRLGCQVVLDNRILDHQQEHPDDQITVTIPSGVNNVWN